MWSRSLNVAPYNPTLGSYRLVAEPLGRVLVISTWNYPFQLSLLPAINALAAGNEVVLKPSEHAPATGRVLAKVAQRLGRGEFKVVLGGIETSQRLVREAFDHIFFTGGKEAAKCILRTAAEKLTPVTLELGGKCPSVVDNFEDLDFVARRIVWGKLLNAGQTCIAPDYVLVNSRVVDSLESKIKTTMIRMTDEIDKGPVLGQIVNSNHFDRLKSIVERSGFSLPERASQKQLHIPPTVVRCRDYNCPLLNEEIFGPILPIVEFAKLDDAIQLINSRPKPLAIYSFSNDDKFHKRLMESTKSGGFCVNDVILQAVDPAVPFGGVGQSGNGKYRGKAGFDLFSNYKSIFLNQNCREVVRAYPNRRERSKKNYQNS